MANLALCPVKLIGCFCAAMLMAAPVFAQPVETFFLIPGEAEATAHLHDQGYALKGSRLRLGIQADQSSKITLSYFNPAGDETELLQDIELAPGILLLVPSEEDWFTLDGEPGPYNFVLETDSGHTVSQTVNLLPAAAPPLPADLRPALEFGQISIPRTLPLHLKGNIRSARDFKGNKIVAPGDISLRGVGAELYKKSAPGVVVVVAGDAFGSGSIISQDGTILANWHVVQGQDSVGVYFKPPGRGEIAAADRFEADVLKADEVELCVGRLPQSPGNTVHKRECR